MPQFVRENISLRKLARRSEPPDSTHRKSPGQCKPSHPRDNRRDPWRTLRRRIRTECNRGRVPAWRVDRGYQSAAAEAASTCSACHRVRTTQIVPGASRRHREQGPAGLTVVPESPVPPPSQGKEVGPKNETENQQNNRATDADMDAAKLETTATAAFIAAVLDVLALATGHPFHEFVLLKYHSTFRFQQPSTYSENTAIHSTPETR